MKGKYLTIPNLLSVFRLLLIPVIIWLYCGKQAYNQALAVLILSGVTDIADGFIARKWNQTSDLGKALDPIADKLTQIATAWCLVSRYEYLWLLLGVLVVKEVFAGITGLYAVKKSGRIKSSDWHGKVNTALLYAVMGLHMLWTDIPAPLSKGLMVLCIGMMCLSAVLYWLRNLRQIRGEG